MGMYPYIFRSSGDREKEALSGGGSLCADQGQQSDDSCSSRRKFSSEGLRNPCRFKFPESAPGKFMVGIFKYSTIWGEKVFCFFFFLNNLPCEQEAVITWKLFLKCHFFREDQSSRETTCVILRIQQSKTGITSFPQEKQSCVFNIPVSLLLYV